jgi:hypothetical protein
VQEGAVNLPTTVSEVIERVLVNTERGRPQRSHDVMTPTRYTILVELLQAGVKPALVVEAERRINASGWLKKPALDVTDEDLERLAVEKPWERQKLSAAWRRALSRS